MLKPEIGQLLTECESPYSVVVAIAKRSRDISEAAEASGEELRDKAINIAIEEFGAHKAVVRYAEEEEPAAVETAETVEE